MKNTLLITIVSVSLLLSSCFLAFPPSINKKLLTKGNSMTEFLNDDQKPSKRFAVSTGSASSAKIEILVYYIRYGEHTSTYFAAFSDEKLIFWGYPNEFARSYDPYINQVGKAAIAAYLKIK